MKASHRRLFGQPQINRHFTKSVFPEIEKIEGWLSIYESYLLFTLAKHSYPEGVLEVGSYQGKSTVSLAIANSANKVQSVDPHTGDISEVLAGKIVNTERNLRDNLENNNVKNVDVFVGTSEQFYRSGKQHEFGFVYIDGWHSYEAVVEDISFWNSKSAKKFTILFDDWTDLEVNQAIRENIANLPPCMGWVGKILVFSNDPRVQNSEFRKFWKKQRGLLKFLSFFGLDQKFSPYRSASVFFA